MAEATGIEWCDSTFNPFIGCTKVGPGCDNCYAEELMDKRMHIVQWGPGQPRHRTGEKNWNAPVRWEREHEAFFAEHGRRRRVFCASLADVFDNEVPAGWRVDLFNLIAATPNLDWLLLTKRIGNVVLMLRDMGAAELPSNVWLGATVVNQQEYDRDIGKLRRIPAAARFLSVEPMLGHIDMRMGGASVPDYAEHRPLLPLDWVIVGGESGPKARPMHPDWTRSMRDQCAAAGVPYLFKQHGEWIGVPDLRALPGGNGPGFGAFDHCPYDREHEAVRIGKKVAGRLLDGIEHNGYPSTERIAA